MTSIQTKGTGSGTISLVEVDISEISIHFEGKVDGFGRIFSTIRLRATDPKRELGSVEGNACIFAPDHSLITSPVRGSFRRVGDTFHTTHTDAVSDGRMNIVRQVHNLATKEVDIQWFSTFDTDS